MTDEALNKEICNRYYDKHFMDKEEDFICKECKTPLSKEDEYHVQWETCNSYCYGKMVGAYV